MLSEKRNEAAATAFFKQAIDNNGFPKKVVMDKSGANYVGLENINFLLMLAGLISFVEILQVKYLNNLIEQDHRFIKKITKSPSKNNLYRSIAVNNLPGQLTNKSCTTYFWTGA